MQQLEDEDCLSLFGRNLSDGWVIVQLGGYLSLWRVGLLLRLN